MEQQVQNYIENLEKATAEQERIITELSLATRIQLNMLPRIFSQLEITKEDVVDK